MEAESVPCILSNKFLWFMFLQMFSDTGFDHKCSLPRNDFLLPLFNAAAHRGHAANKKLLQNK